jgi:hypothetical protein
MAALGLLVFVFEDGFGGVVSSLGLRLVLWSLLSFLFVFLLTC